MWTIGWGTIFQDDRAQFWCHFPAAWRTKKPSKAWDNFVQNACPMDLFLKALKTAHAHFYRLTLEALLKQCPPLLDSQSDDWIELLESSGALWFIGQNLGLWQSSTCPSLRTEVTSSQNFTGAIDMIKAVSQHKEIRWSDLCNDLARQDAGIAERLRLQLIQKWAV